MGTLGNVYGKINSSATGVTSNLKTLINSSNKQTSSENSKNPVDINQFNNLPTKATEKPLVNSKDSFDDMNTQVSNSNKSINSTKDPKVAADDLNLSQGIKDTNKGFKKVKQQKNPVADTIETIHPPNPGDQFSYKNNKEAPVEDSNKSKVMDWLVDRMVESATNSDVNTPSGKAPDSTQKNAEMPNINTPDNLNNLNTDSPPPIELNSPTKINTPPARKNPAMNPGSFTKKPTERMGSIPKFNIPNFKFKI